MRETLEKNQYISYLGMEFLEMRVGYAKARMKVKKELLNPYGAMHGGSLYSMADTIGGVAACMSGFYVVTVSGSMNYLKPAVNTEYVTCEANCVREGRELAVYDLRILNDHGDILENGSFTYFHLNEKVK